MPTRYNEIGLAGRSPGSGAQGAIDGSPGRQQSAGVAADPFLRQYVIAIDGVASVATQDTGFEMPANGVVVGGYLNVITPSAGAGAETMDVGNTTDPNGILAAVDVGTAGIKNLIIDPGMSLLSENILFDLVAADLDDLVAELVLMVLASDD